MNPRARENSDEQWIDLAEEAGQLREAMATRPTIDLAKGIVMAARRCSADQAFAQMRQISSQHNIKVIDLAKALVRYVELPLAQLPTTSAELARADVVATHWLSYLGRRDADDGQQFAQG